MRSRRASRRTSRYSHAIRAATLIAASVLHLEPVAGQSLEGLVRAPGDLPAGVAARLDALALRRTTETPATGRLYAVPAMPSLGSSSVATTSTESVDEVAADFLPVAPSPASSFVAVTDNNTVIPPDTHGAVGPNHVVAMTNSTVVVRTRTGTVSVSLSLAAFWSPVYSGGDAFNPRVLYDHDSDRWMATAVADSFAASSRLLIAVSATSDPTGTWAHYSLDVDSANLVWASYPSVGFNSKWIVVQTNMYGISSGSFSRSHIYVFDKAALYAGDSASYMRFSDSTIGATQVPAVTFGSSTMYLLQEWDGYSGKLRLYSITGAIGAEVLSVVATPTISSGWGTSYYTECPQAGPPWYHPIHCGDSRIQNVVLRNNRLWAVQTVNLVEDDIEAIPRAAIQWWKLNTAGVVLEHGRIDDPSAQTGYGYPSIAVNKNNNVLIGYSRFSQTTFASAAYSFRGATDPPSALMSSVVFKNGDAHYYKTAGGDLNRWGDYSSTVVDPTNDTDMWTIQEYAANPSGGADRWGTWWARVVPPATPTFTPGPTRTPTITATPTVTETPTPTATGTPGCGLMPEAGCRTPAVVGKSTLALKDKPDDAKDAFAWVWAKGSVTTRGEFGDPTATTHYDLCLYDASPSLVMTASIPPGETCGKKPCWKPTKRGFTYANKALTPDGVQQLVLTDGVAGKAKITAKGKGLNLDMPPLSLAVPVRVQLKNTAGLCWEAAYSEPKKNDAGQFNAKDAPSDQLPSTSPTPVPTAPVTPEPGPTQAVTPTSGGSVVATPTLSTSEATPSPAIGTDTPTPTASPSPSDGFTDNGDGTVTATDTGLQWEKKDETCPGVHCVNDTYTWSSWTASPYGPDGTAFTTFLPTLNGGSGFAGHKDWRVPTLDELQTLRLPSCSASPCIHPIFGPTAPYPHWSSSTSNLPNGSAWYISFSNGSQSYAFEYFEFHVRAVRGGS